MKICFVHEEYPEETNFGGISTYQKIMAEYYANHGDEVYVVARGNEDKQYVENNVNIIRVGSDNDSNDISSVKKFRKGVSEVLAKLQNENKIDIIETPDWGANTVYFEKYRKVPLVVRLHTPLKIWLDYNNNNFGSTKDSILKWEDIMIKNADAITSCSGLLKKMVLKQYDVRKDIIVIPNPYNGKDFKVTLDNENCDLIFVGSLEERKGVILFAKALNDVLNIYQNICVYIIGKDTNRNDKNISTKEYMLQLIDSKYHSRIKFVGHVKNTEISNYLNKAFLAVFPSTFDNYPYAVLEAMTCGKYIVCSDNIGCVDLLHENNFIFKNNDADDLKNKILEAIMFKQDFINYDNLKIVADVCGQKNVCEAMKKVYVDTINKYAEETILKNDIISVLDCVIDFEVINEFKKIPENLANDVYFVDCDKGKFIVKKYNYDYDFDSCRELYNIYEKNDIKCVKPINDNIILFKNNKYNIFNYVDSSDCDINIDFINNIVNVNRRTLKKSNAIKKCQKYYNYLNSLEKYNNSVVNDVVYVMQKYDLIKNDDLFVEQYLNHGDLSLNNILVSDNDTYLIDFDETIITTKLYDYAVAFIRIFMKKINLNYESILNFILENIPDDSYTIQQYLRTIKFYLCKILLEKFYLYEIDKIDLFSSTQLKDDYKKYMKILNVIERDGDNYYG